MLLIQSEVENRELAFILAHWRPFFFFPFFVPLWFSLLFCGQQSCKA